MLKADTIVSQDTVCSDMLPYVFHGVECNTTGTHYYHQKSSLGCDTLIYACQLEVLSSLDINVGPIAEEICADQGTFDIPYEVLNGALTEYKLEFNQLALPSSALLFQNSTALSSLAHSKDLRNLMDSNPHFSLCHNTPSFLLIPNTNTLSFLPNSYSCFPHGPVL